MQRHRPGTKSMRDSGAGWRAHGHLLALRHELGIQQVSGSIGQTARLHPFGTRLQDEVICRDDASRRRCPHGVCTIHATAIQCRDEDIVAVQKTGALWIGMFHAARTLAAQILMQAFPTKVAAEEVTLHTEAVVAGVRASGRGLDQGGTRSGSSGSNGSSRRFVFCLRLVCVLRASRLPLLAPACALLSILLTCAALSLRGSRHVSLRRRGRTTYFRTGGGRLGAMTDKGRRGPQRQTAVGRSGR